MHKRPIGYVPGKGLSYDKKLKKNPKYANIKGKLKTGKTVKNYKVVSNKHIVKRKGETFYRIKPKTLSKLISVQKFYIRNPLNPLFPFFRNRPILSLCIILRTRSIEKMSCFRIHLTIISLSSQWPL